MRKTRKRTLISPITVEFKGSYLAEIPSLLSSRAPSPEKMEERVLTPWTVSGTTIFFEITMQKVALIYNPESGQHSARRKAAIDAAIAVLREAGISVEAFVTEYAGSATIHAQQAVLNGFDTVLACGGDGTVHEVLQSLVGTDVVLGVVPLGTANALAADLGLTAAPAKVVRTLLTAAPARISVGRIHYHDEHGSWSGGGYSECDDGRTCNNLEWRRR